MTTLSYESPQVPIEISKCRTGLVVFGIILILMGVCMGCLATATPVLRIVLRNMPNPSPQAQIPIRTVIISVLMYGTLSTGFIWTGVGSLKSRRWVAPIVLAAASVTLFVGIFVILAIAMSIPKVGDVMRANARATGAATPDWFITITTSFSVLFALIVYLVIPAVFIWFYRRPVVRQTTEYLDPKPRWTDSIPQPIITLALATMLAAAATAIAFLHSALPAFGKVWTGIPAVLFKLSFLAILTLSSILTLKRLPAGWRLTIAAIVIFTLSSLVNAFRLNPDEFYLTLDLPAEQMEAVREVGLQDPIFSAAIGVITAAIFLAYVLRTKRHFNFPRSESPSQPA